MRLQIGTADILNRVRYIYIYTHYLYIYIYIFFFCFAVSRCREYKVIGLGD